MKTSIYLLLSVVFTIVILLILFLSINQRDEDLQVRLPSDIQSAIEDFQSENALVTGLRKEAATKLMPYIKTGMSKAKVEEFLGLPETEGSSENLSIYPIWYSEAILINYDDKGRVFHIEGPGIEFLDNDRVWPFIRVGMTQELVLTKMYEPDEISDDGKKWLYKGKTYLYTIRFDDNDKVSHLEKTELSPNNETLALMPKADIEFITKKAEQWRDMETVIKGGPPVEEVKRVVNILEKNEIEKEGVFMLLGEPGKKTIGDQAESWNYFLADSRLLVITFDKNGKCVHISGTDIGQ